MVAGSQEMNNMVDVFFSFVKSVQVNQSTHIIFTYLHAVSIYEMLFNSIEMDDSSEKADGPME